MKSTLVQIDCDRITDWDSFHEVFAHVFGFPEFYGRNMNAWIDCMTSLDAPNDGMTSIHAPEDGCVVLHLNNVKPLAERCREIYDAMLESAAFVNWRRIETGEPAILMLSFHE